MTTDPYAEAQAADDRVEAEARSNPDLALVRDYLRLAPLSEKLRIQFSEKTTSELAAELRQAEVRKFETLGFKLTFSA